MHHDPLWPRASEWLAMDSPEPTLMVAGVPVNNSITPGNCHLAPDAVREALAYFSLFDHDADSSLEDLGVKDSGEIDANELADWWRSRPPTARKAVLIGGDNGLTRLGVPMLDIPLERVGLITLDAHLDVRHLGNGPHNGNPIRGLIESGMPGQNIVQVGLQPFANSPAYAAYAREQGVRSLTASQVHQIGAKAASDQALEWLQSTVEAVYFDLDIDVIDRVGCPGAPGARPGGLHAFQAREFAHWMGRNPWVKIMDIVEFDPSLDQNRVTAMACAACLLSFASGVAAVS